MARRKKKKELLAALVALTAGCSVGGDGAGELQEGDVIPPVVENLSILTDSVGGALVQWETDEPATWWIDYGLTTAYGDTVTGGGVPGESHATSLTSLTDGATYHLNVNVMDAAGNESTSGDVPWVQGATGNDQTPPVLSNIQVTVAGTSATISWETDELTVGTVDHGTTTSYGTRTTSGPPYATSHSVTLSGLAQNTTYHYEITSLDVFANSSDSGDAAFQTDDLTPPVISNVQVSVAGLIATISWDTDEPTTGQVDYGTTSSYGTTASSGPPATTSHSVTLGGLSSQTRYHYRITAVDAAANSESTGDAIFQTDDQTPPAISNVQVSLNGAMATVTWNTNELSVGQVEHGTTSSYGSTVTSGPPFATSHSVTLSGLSSETTYHYRVTVADASGNPSATGDATFQTDDLVAPVISNVQVSLNGATATVSWNTDEPTTGQADYGTTAAYGSSAPSGPPPATSHSVTLSGLSSETTYHYRISATDDSGNPSSTGDATFQTDDFVPPVISNAQVSVNGATATVTWTTDEPTTGQVDYGTTTGYGTTASSGPPLATSHSVTLSSLAPGTTYHYRITAQDDSTNSAATGDATFQTDDQTPPVISNVQVSVNGGSATITWSTDEDSVGDVDYGTTTGYGSTASSGPPLASSHSVTLSGLTLDETYHFRVRARDAAANEGVTGDQTFQTAPASGAVVTGNLVAWFPLTISFQGPFATELDTSPNPFLDYRLTVDFSGPSGQSYTVHGFFDGDGNGSGSGDVWRVRFAPDEGGDWSYTASFVQGTDVAIDLAPGAGTPTSFDGDSGVVTIAPRDPAAKGFYKWGLLEYVGEHYLKFRDGPYFLKTGCDSPENLLAYKGFDNTLDQGGVDTSGLENGLHRYLPHEGDWGPSGLGDSNDPLFVSADTGHDSKGIIGALNYFASRNVNSIYFLPMNLGGDGQEVCPFVGFSGSSFDNTHYDVSKLHQWHQVFEHATGKGIQLHIVLNEQEFANRDWLDSGSLGTERKLFYRELVARFGHALAIKWNISEENKFTVAEVLSFADYIQSVDPYDHPIATHSGVLASTGDEAVWTGTIGDPRISSNAMQGGVFDVGSHVERWRSDSAAAGRKWVVEMDEVTTGLTDTNVNYLRIRALYAALFSGGGIEWYMGYFALPLGGDLRCEDFRTREVMWNQSWYARKFMEENLPFWEMEPSDGLVVGEDSGPDGTQAEVFAKIGDSYAIYYPVVSNTGTLDLSGATGDFQKRWYNPLTGAFEGTTEIVTGGGPVAIGSAPSGGIGSDWVVLVQK